MLFYQSVEVEMLTESIVGKLKNKLYEEGKKLQGKRFWSLGRPGAIKMQLNEGNTPYLSERAY